MQRLLNKHSEKTPQALSAIAHMPTARLSVLMVPLLLETVFTKMVLTAVAKTVVPFLLLLVLLTSFCITKAPLSVE